MLRSLVSRFRYHFARVKEQGPPQRRTIPLPKTDVSEVCQKPPTSIMELIHHAALYKYLWEDLLFNYLMPMEMHMRDESLRAILRAGSRDPDAVAQAIITEMCDVIHEARKAEDPRFVTTRHWCQSYEQWRDHQLNELNEDDQQTAESYSEFFALVPHPLDDDDEDMHRCC